MGGLKMTTELTISEVLNKMNGKVGILAGIGLLGPLKATQFQMDIISMEIRSRNDDLDAIVIPQIHGRDSALNVSITLLKGAFVGGPIGSLMNSLIDPKKTLEMCIEDCVSKFSKEEYEAMVSEVGLEVLKMVGLKGNHVI